MIQSIRSEALGAPLELTRKEFPGERASKNSNQTQDKVQLTFCLQTLHYHHLESLSLFSSLDPTVSQMLTASPEDCNLEDRFLVAVKLLCRP